MEMPIPAVSNVDARDELRRYRKDSLVVTVTARISPGACKLLRSQAGASPRAASHVATRISTYNNPFLTIVDSK
jgi:hypothetical protein